MTHYFSDHEIISQIRSY